MAKKNSSEKMYWPYPISVHGNQVPMIFGREAKLTRDGEAHTVEVPKESIKNECTRAGRRLLTSDEYESLISGVVEEEVDDPDYPNPNKK